MKRFSGSLLAGAMLTMGIVFAGPLLWDRSVFGTFDHYVRSMHASGNGLIGLEFSGVRQNIFSLALDMRHVARVSDHGEMLESRIFSLARFASRGALWTNRDVLAWFGVPLTVGQARQVRLCDAFEGASSPHEALLVQADPSEYGVASWYGPGFHGRLAASGEIYNMYDQTAAHKSWPLQSLVRVVHQPTGRSIVVRINDRGPYIAGRIIDLSYQAKELLGMGDLGAVYLEKIDTGLDQIDCR